jgi:hypothetical protein
MAQWPSRVRLIQRSIGRVVAIGLVLVSVTLLYIVKSAPDPHIDVYDGFETSRLSGIWETSRFAPGAVTMQSEVVRTGHGAAKIVLHTHDIFEAGIKGDADSERAELLEAEKLVAKEDIGYEYSFSIFIPVDFPTVRTRLVLAQWKQDCAGHAPCSNDAPVLAMRYVAGVLSITRQSGGERTTLFKTGENLRGKWTDCRFQVRFSATESGHVKAWLNGDQVVDYTGMIAFPENASTGYSSPSRFYFKMGLYRDVMAEPMTIYVDEYRKRQLSDQF